jgi:acetyl-CoA carboxylase biotin carboxyl carrier protein
MSTYKPNAAEAAWIRELASILDETGLNEVEIQKADFRVRVSKGGGAFAYAAPAGTAAPASAPAQRTKTDAPAPAAAPDKSKAVPSPMVGTIYLSPAPGANPFIKVGDSVAAGQTLMIVEAMKTMNPIPAPRAGVVKDILVRDAQPVEYGEALVIVD